MATPTKRKRDDACSSKATAASRPLLSSWPEILAGIQGQKGEPGAILALNQLCRLLPQQAASATSKKSSNDPDYQIWLAFLDHWQQDPGLKDVVAVWERGDQAGNNTLTVAALQTYTTLLTIASLPSAGIISVGSPHQRTLAKLINELVELLHYLHKYLIHSGKNDLTTAALEVVGALLKIVRYSPSRNITSRKIWLALKLEAKDVCRLLNTKRKIPMVTKRGRQPDIRHLMLSVLLTLLAPAAATSIKTDILSMKGVIISIWKNLCEDPREVVESTLECMGRIVALERFPIEIRCRVAEDSWSQALKLYERDEVEGEPESVDAPAVYPPALSAHRYLLYVVSALCKAPSAQSGITSHQKRALGALLALLQTSDSEEQVDVALYILSHALEMLPGFWARFAPSLEPRISSKWITSIGLASQIVGAPFSQDLVKILAHIKDQPLSKRPQPPSISLLLDTCLMPAHLGKSWSSKALLQSQSSPLVAFLTCNFLFIGLKKCSAILSIFEDISAALRVKGDPVGAAIWHNDAKRMQQEAQDRLPDVQVLIAIVQTGLGRNFVRAGSVASSIDNSANADGDSLEEDNSLLVSLAVRTILSYKIVHPSALSTLRFDFGRLLNSSFFKADPQQDKAPLISVGQTALLELVGSAGNSLASEGTINWSWSKIGDSGRSPLASIIGLYLSSPIPMLKSAAKNTATNLLASSLLFEHDSTEVDVWVSAILHSHPGQEETLGFLDTCISRTLQTPFKYIDRVQDLVRDAESGSADSLVSRGSPLLAAVLEQLQYRLSRSEDPTVYVLFTQRLTVALSCHHNNLRLATAFAQAVRNVVDQQESHTAATTIWQETEGLLHILIGKDSAQKMTHAPVAREDPLHPVYSVLAHLDDLDRFDYTLVTADNIFSLAQLSLHYLSSVEGARPAALHFLKRLLEISSTLLPNPQSLCDRVFGNQNLFRMFLEARKIKSNLGAAIIDLLPTSKGIISAKTLEPYLEELVQVPDAEDFSALKKLIAWLSQPQLLTLMRHNLEAEGLDRPARQDLLSKAAALLVPLAHTISTQEFVSSYWTALFDCGNEDVDELLAACAEACLPSGLSLAPSSHPAVKKIWPANAAQMVLAGKRQSTKLSRIVAAGLYQSSEVLEQFQNARSTENVKQETYHANAPSVLAYIEVVQAVEGAPFALSTVSGYSPTTVVEAFYKPTDQETRLYSAHTISLLGKSGGAVSAATIKAIQDRLQPAASASALIFDVLSIDTLSSLCQTLQTVDAFAALEAFINESLRWLVRRFAEDSENIEQVTAFIEALEPCLAESTNKWLLKPHLVEPVIQAGIQNRLTCPKSLKFLARLITESRLQTATMTRLLQQLLSDNRFRSGLSTSSRTREGLLLAVLALHRHAPSVIDEIGAIPLLLAAYQGSTAPADESLMEILRIAELKGSTSIRSIVSRWVPPDLRGSCSTPVQVLAAVNPQNLHNTCVQVLKGSPGSKSDSQSISESLFFLPYLGTILDGEVSDRPTWMALVQSNILGLAICALASKNTQTRLAGDRLLAKAKNSLQSADFREKDEILYVLDSVRNLIDPAATSSEPISPLMALFLARAMHCISTPEAPEYPLIWRFLLSRPMIDTHDVPLFYNLFYSASEDSLRDRKWLITMLLEGVHSTEDWRIVRRRQTVDLLLGYLESGIIDDEAEMRVAILKFFSQVSKIVAASQDLVARNGFFVTLAGIRPQSAEENGYLIEIVDNLVSAVRPSKLRRARDGLWLVEAVKALEAVSASEVPPDHLGVFTHALRRLVVYACSNEDPLGVNENLWRVSVPLVKRLSQQAGAPQSTIRNLFDAILRLDAVMKNGKDQAEVVSKITDLALVSKVEGVKEEMLRVLHKKNHSN